MFDFIVNSAANNCTTASIINDVKMTVNRGEVSVSGCFSEEGRRLVDG